MRVADALGLGASEFVYGPSRARVKHTEFEGAAVAKTVTYIGADFERRAPASGPAALVHYVRANGTVVAEVTRADGTPAADKTRYLHRDHLGSVALVTDEAGNVAEDRSFGPWGQARNADWSTPASPPPLTETPRGFTGHEHLQTVGLIHMNGRVYDPKIGRFMSPDPFVQAPNDARSFNRYAYVVNNPVSLTDPSGFLWGVAAKVAKLGFKGFDIGATIAGAVEDFDTLTNSNASLGQRALAGLSLASEIVSPVSLRDLKAIDKFVDKVVDKTKAPSAAGAGGTPGGPPSNNFNGGGGTPPGGAGGPPSGDGAKPIHSRYGDGTPVYKGEQPPRLGEPTPSVDADGPYTELRWDPVNGRVYQGREFDPNGYPVRDVDFTSPTYPGGGMRPDHAPAPHQHQWEVNDPRVGPRSGFKRGKGEPLVPDEPQTPEVP